MLKITAIGNLTNEVTLKKNDTGLPYAILRIASDRRYKDKDGNHLTDYISIKVRPMPGRAVSWQPWAILKPSSSGMIPTASRDS